MDRTCLCTFGPAVFQRAIGPDDRDPAAFLVEHLSSGRDQSGFHPEVAVEKYRTVDRAIKEAERFDLMILDGPAHAEQGGRVMAQNSDLVLMPTGYSLDDMEPQIEAAYELEDNGVPSDRIFFCFCRAKGSEAEDRAARTYLGKARVNVLDPIFPELASIRQGHAEGRAASEVPFSRVQEKAVAVAQAIMNRLPGVKEAA